MEILDIKAQTKAMIDSLKAVCTTYGLGNASSEYVSILFIDKKDKSGEVVLMDASKLGTKEKIDGKNQKTVLNVDEVNYIIETFVSKKAVPEFCVITSCDAIVAKKYSISPGQFFETIVLPAAKWSGMSS